MTKPCKQTVIPQLDNTEYKCDECGYIDTDCVTTSTSFPYLEIIAGSSLTKILESISKKIIKVGSRLARLENYYVPTTVTTADHIISSKDTTIYFAPTSAAGNCTLPTITLSNIGRELTFINHSGNIKTLGTYTINDSTTGTTIANNEVLKLKAIGSLWIKI